MKFSVIAYAAEFGAAPGRFDYVLSQQAPQVLYSDLTESVESEHAQFFPASQVAFTQPALAENRLERWQALITTALTNTDLVLKTHDAALLMVLPYVETKHGLLQRQLIDSVAQILPAWTTHPNTEYYLLGSAGFFQALRQADKLLNAGQAQVVIGAVDSWATEQDILKFVSRFSDYAAVLLPASEGAIFIVLSRPISRQAKGIEVLGCGMDAVIDKQSPNGLIALVGDMKTAQPTPMAYLSMSYSGDNNLDQVGDLTLAAIPGLYDSNTQFITPQINQGDIGACYSLLQFLLSYHHYEQHIWQGTSLQIDTSSLPFVGAAVYRWFY